MDDGEVLSSGWWHFDARRRVGERLRWEEFKRQVRDGFPELGPRGAVPGVDRVEPIKQRALGCSDADEIEPGVGDRSRAVGETD
jgi:hypothetical protein